MILHNLTGHCVQNDLSIRAVVLNNIPSLKLFLLLIITAILARHVMGKQRLATFRDCKWIVVLFIDKWKMQYRILAKVL